MVLVLLLLFVFFFQAEDGIRDKLVTGVQTCALPIYVEAAADVLVRIGALALDGETLLTELDINPMRVLPVGHGCKALDASLLLLRDRSEERRVGKECRSRWSAYD